MLKEREIILLTICQMRRTESLPFVKLTKWGKKPQAIQRRGKLCDKL